LQKYRVLALATALMFLLGGCTVFGKPVTYRPLITAFYLNSAGTTTDPLPSLEKYGADMDTFSPLWYHVRADGSLQSEVQPQAVSIARKYKLKIVPLINLVSNQDAILTNATSRSNAVDNLVKEIQTNNWDGVNIDFEFIPTGQKDFSYDRPLLTEFIKDLDQKLKPLRKEMDMSVLPHYGVSADVSSIYDYSHLAPYLDHVTLMTYDKSQESSPPGPVAPFSWVEQNITTAMKQGFKPEQICLGVATYGYNWPAGQSGGFSEPTKTIMQKASTLGVPVKWSSQYQEPFYYYTDSEGNQREVWFENSATLKQKIDLAKKYRLYGICIWRLGFEDPSFWNVIKSNIPK